MPAVNTRTGNPTRILATTLLICGVVVAVAGARPATRPEVAPEAGGLSFNYTITSTSADKQLKKATELRAAVRMQGGNVRMDYTDGTGPMGQAGAYILITSSPPQFAMVSDKDKTVMIMDAAMLGGGAGSMMNNPMMKMTVSNSRFSYKDLGAGENILGYKTRHVRVFSGADIEMKAMGMTQKSSSSDSSDQWIAQGLDVDENALAAWGKSFTKGMNVTSPEMAAEVSRFQKEFGRSGMALRSITWSSRIDNGKATSDTTRMEVSNLVKGAISDAVFKMPEGYQVTNLSEMMKSAQSQTDSAKKPSGADSAKGKQPSASDAIKAGLGGMFKKKPPQ